ncbi:MAG TPA: preprotein translocase subunit SecY [Clostridiaceae bacterium]
MLSTLRNAWKVADLRKRIFFTLAMLVIFRFGNFITVPFVDASKLTSLGNQGTLFGFYNLISGGAFARCSIFAMGVVPYINSSIIIQLLTIAIPYLEQLSKEGEDGRKKIQNYTRYGAVAFGLIQAFGQYAIMTQLGAVTSNSIWNIMIIMLVLITGSTFLMWLGEQITVKGIGNGVSLLIFINIVSRMPDIGVKIVSYTTTGSINIVEVVGFVLVVIAMFVAVVIASLAERRIPVQYAGRTVAGKTYKGQSTHIPININGTAVIAIIFAMSVMQFPATIAQFTGTNSAFYRLVMGNGSVFKDYTWQYSLIYFILIVFFTWFYSEVTFKPDEMAENIHKSSGFIPGIRPGEATAKYISGVLTRIAILGGLFASVIAIFPVLIQGYTNFKDISFGGTMLLIMVGVSLDTVRQIESQLVMRHYQGFLK